VEHTTRTRFRAGEYQAAIWGPGAPAPRLAAVPLCYVAKRSPVPPRQPDPPPSEVLTDGQNASIRPQSGLDLIKQELTVSYRYYQVLGREGT
jgi:hypothetical protein